LENVLPDKQTVQAKNIIDALTESKPTKPVYTLRNARIEGKLNLRHCTVFVAVDMQDCEFLDEVDLRYCEFMQTVDFAGCIFRKEFNSGDLTPFSVPTAMRVRLSILAPS
jgi:hypothetical protein